MMETSLLTRELQGPQVGAWCCRGCRITRTINPLDILGNDSTTRWRWRASKCCFQSLLGILGVFVLHSWNHHWLDRLQRHGAANLLGLVMITSHSSGTSTGWVLIISTMACCCNLDFFVFFSLILLLSFLPWLAIKLRVINLHLLIRHHGRISTLNIRVKIGVTQLIVRLRDWPQATTLRLGFGGCFILWGQSNIIRLFLHTLLVGVPELCTSRIRSNNLEQNRNSIVLLHVEPLHHLVQVVPSNVKR